MPGRLGLVGDVLYLVRKEMDAERKLNSISTNKGWTVHF